MLARCATLPPRLPAVTTPLVRRTVGPAVRCVTSDVQAASSPVHAVDRERKDTIDKFIRVDHAGEYGAVRIYDGQLAVLKGTPAYDVVKEMRVTEVDHLATMDELIADRRVRPTALLPLWNAAGFALGAATALLGTKAAMACTVAVEEAIGEHYNDQIRTILAEGYPEDELKTVLKRHRDEELDHLNTALDHDAEQAPFYTVLKTVIKTGCTVAIKVAERV